MFWNSAPLQTAGFLHCVCVCVRVCVCVCALWDRENYGEMGDEGSRGGSFLLSE